MTDAEKKHVAAILRWLRDNPCQAFSVYPAPPAEPQRIRLKSGNASRTVAVRRWRMAAPYIQPAPAPERMFGLNLAGMMFLQQQEKNDA